MCLGERRLAMRYRAAGPELNADRPTNKLDKVSLNRSTHKQGRALTGVRAIVQCSLWQRARAQRAVINQQGASMLTSELSTPV